MSCKVFVFLFFLRHFVHDKRVEAIGHFSLFDLASNFVNPINGNDGGLGTSFQLVYHLHVEDIGLHESGYAIFGADGIHVLGEGSQCIHISIELIVQAAFQAATLTGKLSLVDRQVLIAGR